MPSATVTVTVTDEAGNTDTKWTIVFPAVGKGDQMLTGFAYSASSVQFGATAPTVTGPSGVETTLSYTVSEDSESLCSVDPNTGALMINGVGACAVTATAEGSANYNEASVTVTVMVQSTGNLVLNVDGVAVGDTINIAEKAAGFAISGDTGSEAGVAVTVTARHGTSLPAATSADVADHGDLVGARSGRCVVYHGHERGCDGVGHQDRLYLTPQRRAPPERRPDRADGAVLHGAVLAAGGCADHGHESHRRQRH